MAQWRVLSHATVQSPKVFCPPGAGRAWSSSTRAGGGGVDDDTVGRLASAPSGAQAASSHAAVTIILPATMLLSAGALPIARVKGDGR